MNYKKLSYKTLLVYFINIPLLFLILGLKLNIYLTETEEHHKYDTQIHTELVLQEHSNNNPLLTTDNYYFNYTFDNVCEVSIFDKYKNAIISYNHLILIRYKYLDSNPLFISSIISILKHHNICNKSPEEKPSIIC